MVTLLSQAKLVKSSSVSALENILKLTYTCGSSNANRNLTCTAHTATPHKRRSETQVAHLCFPAVRLATLGPFVSPWFRRFVRRWTSDVH